MNESLFPDALGIPTEELEELRAIGEQLTGHIQDACNMSGVLEWFNGRPLKLLQCHVLHKQGTSAFNHHPYIVLLVSKLSSLSDADSGGAFMDAMGQVQRFVLNRSC